MNFEPAPEMEKRRPDLEAMVRQYGNGLLRMCFLYLRDVSLAEDAVQETFAAAWAKYDSFAGRSSEKTWLTAIAANVCRNMLKSAWHRHMAGPDGLESLSVSGPDVRDPTVTRAVLALPTPLREVVVLHYYRGLRVETIASMLKLPRPTVSSRLARARKKLRNELKEWYFNEE
ncbi:MAG: RNA polymerase subunit sigma-70 [Clostridia bacterium]|nr:RNA polymerase subunit sigma-70 [Clostridia bacterium]